jgi:hypothetical protein
MYMKNDLLYQWNIESVAGGIVSMFAVGPAGFFADG